MTGYVSAPPSGRPRPRFEPANHNALLRLRLTVQQIDSLECHLGEIADWLLPRAQGNNVRDELERMARILERAEKLLREWRAAPARVGDAGSARAEALGHFNVAAAGLVRGTAGLDLDDELDPAALITMTANLARRAADQAPKGAQRTQQRSPRQAVAVIVRQLWRPEDADSRRRASELIPSLSGDFRELVDIVWPSVLGGSSASPERAIREYMRHPRTVALLVPAR